MKYALLLTIAAGAYGQAGLVRPVLGQMLDREGVLRPVTGLGGSFQLEAAVAAGVAATACSRELCIAKTEAALIAGTSSVAAPAGGALLAVDGSSAWIYFSSTGQFARWQDGALAAVNLAVDGEVLAMRAGPGGVQVAVRRATGVWLVAGDGTIVDSLPSDAGAVLLLADSTVYATVYSKGDALVLRQSGGSETRFAAAGVTALFAMGEGYVEAVAPGAIYALRTVAGREQLFVLPQAPDKRRH